jgi:hypothetical protein
MTQQGNTRHQTIAELAATLPQAPKVKVPFTTYKNLVAEGLKAGDCRLCIVCGEPIWLHVKHLCFEIQTHHYTTVNVEEELKHL